jgi:protein TonB
VVGNQLFHSPSEVTVATERVSFEAQREFPRWPVPGSKPVRVDLGPAGSGQLMDISLGGARVKSVAPLRRDTEVPLRIDIPERLEPLRCLGRVVWSKPNGAAGLRFTNLPDEQKAGLAAWIDELRDAAGPKGRADDEFTRISAQIKNMKLNNADALSLIARRATQIAAADAVVIALGKPEHMICMAHAGSAPEIGAPVSALGLTGECVRSRKVVHCLDASTDPRAGELRQGSALILPLIVNGELRGVMQVFAPRPGIFNAERTESIEQLADAVVFVTHNVLPRVRSSQAALASVTPIRPIASAPAVSKLSETGRMAAFSAPPLTKPSDSGRIAVFSATSPMPAPAPVAVAPEPAFASAPLAVQTMASEVEPAVVRPQAVEPRRVAPRIPPTVKPTYVPAPPPSSSRRVVVVAAAVVIVVFSAAFGIRYLRHQPAPLAAVASAAPAEPASSVVVTPQPAAVTVTPSEVAPAAMVRKPTSVKEERPLERVEKKPVPVQSDPAPAAIVLASGAPLPRVQTPEPVAAPPVDPIAAAPMPGIKLPVAVAAPKLTAPPPRVIAGGTLLEHPSPVYPQFAITERLEGQVKLQVTITPEGKVGNIRLLSGPQLLAGAAENAVRRWRYSPPTINGQPTSREATITVDFKLPSQRN